MTWDTSCLAPGPHVISAYFICDYKLMQFYCYTGTPTTATTSYTQPEYVQNVGASVEQSSPTSIRVHMPYVFANSTGSRGLKLEHFLPNGQPDNFFWSSGAPTPAGEWTKDFDISCWLPGSHRFVVTATACDQWSRTAETATTVGPENPSISATVVTTGPNAARVDMPFSFPPTVNSRATALYHTKPDGSTDTVYWIGPSDQQSGSWSQPFDTTCWPTGTHTFLATATSCNRTTNSATATLEIVRKPHVDVAIVKGNGTKTAQISYQFPDNEPNGRSLSVEFLPVFPATGVTQLIVPMHPIPVSPGSISVDIPSFGTDGVLRVQASNSCGETDVKDTFIECDCHADEGDKTVGGPVRLWDGSMTYSERDPGTYRYDAMGNMLARDLGGTVEVDPDNPLLRRGALTASPDALPAPGSLHETYAYAGTTSQLSTMTSAGIDHPITYDAAGNELRYYDTRTYSPRNVMSSISEPSEDNRSHTITYGYDGRGVRVIRSEGLTNDPAPFATRHYTYSPELQLLSVTVDDNPNVWGKTAIANVVPATKHQYAWFNGRPVLDLVNGSTLLYTFDDHLGTPLLQTDAAGSVVWRAEYEPYGDVWTMRTGASGDQLLRFPGQEYVGKWEGTEERYNIFRWYRAGWGRFTSADPIGLAGGLNLFRYAAANPIAKTDRKGLVCDVNWWSENLDGFWGTIANWAIDHQFLTWPTGGLGFQPDGGSADVTFMNGIVHPIPGHTSHDVAPLKPVPDDVKHETSFAESRNSACLNCKAVWQCLDNFAKQFDSKKEWCVLGDNCHTAVNDALSACGLSKVPPTPPSPRFPRNRPGDAF
ncbi:MAG TPA: RHS repeat-associated core domain-containing protein [Thermoanaerobaculia bacterium]